jgi:hypothetical protein
MSDRARMRVAALGLLACLIAVGWLEKPGEHGPIKPNGNAPAYVDWRTGEVVQP